MSECQEPARGWMYSMGMDLIFEVRDAEEGGCCARLLAMDLTRNGSGSSRRLAERSKCGPGACRRRRARGFGRRSRRFAKAWLLGGDWPRTLDELEELRRH